MSVLLVLGFSTAKANSHQNPCISLFCQIISTGEDGLRVLCALRLYNQEFHVVFEDGGTKVFHSYKLLGGLLCHSRASHKISDLYT